MTSSEDSKPAEVSGETSGEGIKLPEVPESEPSNSVESIPADAEKDSVSTAFSGFDDFNKEQISENTSTETSLPDSIDPFVSTDDDQLEGGEWSLLSGKISDWFKNKNFEIKGLGKPLLLVAYVLGIFAVLQVYGSVLETIARVPSAPRLFQLVGLVWLISFSVSNLIRTQDREQVISGLINRWKNFSGDSDS